MFPNTYLGVELGAAGDPRMIDPPHHLQMKLFTWYQQGYDNYCVMYSFTSALYHCGLHLVAEVLYPKARVLQWYPWPSAVQYIHMVMKALAPSIGFPTIYGQTTSKKCK